MIKKYAFFSPGLTALGRLVVTEIVEAPRTQDGHTFQLHELYHADIVRQARMVSDTVSVGDELDLSTGEYTTPEVAEATSGDEDGGGGTGNGEPPPPPPKK